MLSVLLWLLTAMNVTRIVDSLKQYKERGKVMERRKRDFINRIHHYLILWREKKRKTFLQKVIRGGRGWNVTRWIVYLGPSPYLLLLLSNTFSFVIRKDSDFLFIKVSPSETRRRLYFHATPFALNEFHSANRRESLPSSTTGFLLFTRFLPTSRQFPWLFFNFHAYFLPPSPPPFLLSVWWKAISARNFAFSLSNQPKASFTSFHNRIKPALLRSNFHRLKKEIINPFQTLISSLGTTNIRIL